MSERELIEAAAKAAGYAWREDVAKERDALGVVGLWIPGLKTAWNPLADDGDALRLAVKLRLLVGIHLDESWAQSYGTAEGEWITIKEQNGVDAGAATRRAIVRAAAEIARAQAA